jgi:hypothetical protein
VSELTTEQMREYVERLWGKCKCIKSDRTHPAKDGTWVDYIIQPEAVPFLAAGATPEKAWAAARTFTVKREEYIDLVELEIVNLHNLIAPFIRLAPDGNLCVIRTNRTITRLQSILAELKHGMKGGK